MSLTASKRRLMSPLVEMMPRQRRTAPVVLLTEEPCVVTGKTEIAALVQDSAAAPQPTAETVVRVAVALLELRVLTGHAELPTPNPSVATFPPADVALLQGIVEVAQLSAATAANLVPAMASLLSDLVP